MYKRPGRQFEDRQMWEIRAGESKHKQVRSVKGTLAGGGKKAPEPSLSSGAWFPCWGEVTCVCLGPAQKAKDTVDKWGPDSAPNGVQLVVLWTVIDNSDTSLLSNSNCCVIGSSLRSRI